MSCNCGGVRADIAALGRFLKGHSTSKPEKQAEKELKKKSKKKNETDK